MSIEEEALRKQVAELRKYIIENELLRNEQMKSLLSKLLYQLGAQLIFDLIKGPENTDELDERIRAAKTKDDVRNIIKDELINAIAEGDEDEEIAEGLINARTTDDIIAVASKPKVQKGILEAIGGLIASLIKLITGKS